MLFRAAEYNLVSRDAVFSQHITMVDGSNLKKYVDRSMLDFDDVLYMLECNSNINYLHDYNRYDEFMDLLARQKKKVVYHKGGAKEAT